LGLLAVQFLLRTFDVFRRIATLRLAFYSLILGAMTAVIVAMLPFGYKPFIYFQF